MGQEEKFLVGISAGTSRSIPTNLGVRPAVEGSAEDGFPAKPYDTNAFRNSLGIRTGIGSFNPYQFNVH
jgi:hypothetical protein